MTQPHGWEPPRNPAGQTIALVWTSSERGMRTRPHFIESARVRQSDLPSGRQARRRVSLSVVALVVLAVVLSVAGGAVPGIQHHVTSGDIPPELSPEHYLGPPYAGSVSGRWAAEGALFWSVIALAGLIALRSLPPMGVVLLATATLITALVNVALPLLWPNVGWSILGVAQTVATLGSLVLTCVPRTRRGHRPTVEAARRVRAWSCSSPASSCATPS